MELTTSEKARLERAAKLKKKSSKIRKELEHDLQQIQHAFAASGIMLLTTVIMATLTAVFYLAGYLIL